MAEFRKAEALQRAVWGEGDLPDPADLMMVIQTEGGLVAGAFVDDRLLGYVFGFPTRDANIQYSHRLAVLAEARGLGLGRHLKLYQRDWCLARRIERVRWTFDPLLALNAALNIHRLGATSSVYLEDFYGEMGGINSGLPSDRLLVDWDLNTPAVEALARDEARHMPSTIALDFALPDDLASLARTNPDRANELRLGLRRHLQQAFAAGRSVIDFDRERRVYLTSR